MSNRLPINTQEIDYDIHIIINDKDEDDANCFSTCTRFYGMRLDEKEIEILKTMNIKNNKLFKIEYYSHKDRSRSRSSKSKSTNTITIKDKLVNSIHNRLCPNQSNLQTYLRNTISTSTFTIFINNKNSSSTSSVYDPICIATVSKEEDEEHGYKYLYVNVFCGSIHYNYCGKHLMNTMKLIAYHFGYKYIKLSSINYLPTLTWYECQGFREEPRAHSSNYYAYSLRDLYYKIREKDQYYDRSEIKGECKIIERSSPDEDIKLTSSLYPLRKSRKQYKKNKKNTQKIKTSSHDECIKLTSSSYPLGKSRKQCKQLKQNKKNTLKINTI